MAPVIAAKLHGSLAGVGAGAEAAEAGVVASAKTTLAKAVNNTRLINLSFKCPWRGSRGPNDVVPKACAPCKTTRPQTINKRFINDFQQVDSRRSAFRAKNFVAGQQSEA